MSWSWLAVAVAARISVAAVEPVVFKYLHHKSFLLIRR
jgi:hypothetical protein